MKKNISVLLVILSIVVLLVLLGAGYYAFRMSGLGVDTAHPQVFIQADFIDLNRIQKISKFRSGAGHDFSGGSETCRSMKHYFTPFLNDDAYAYKKANGEYPVPDGKTDINIYSPVDGKISAVIADPSGVGDEVQIIASAASDYVIRIFHIYLLPGFGAGTEVKAGEKIAVIGQYQTISIAIQAGQLAWNNSFVSYFDVMPAGIFLKYRNAGIASVSELVISKEYRDANPFGCESDGEGSFIYPKNYNSVVEDFVILKNESPTPSPEP